MANNATTIFYVSAFFVCSINRPKEKNSDDGRKVLYNKTFPDTFPLGAFYIYNLFSKRADIDKSKLPFYDYRHFLCGSGQLF